VQLRDCQQVSDDTVQHSLYGPAWENNYIFGYLNDDAEQVKANCFYCEGLCEIFFSITHPAKFPSSSPGNTAMSTYTHQTHTTAAPLVRSGSFFGTIKNIVTAPFNWFTGPEDEFEDTKGKRRRLPVTSDQGRPEDDSLQGRTKRMRVSGPDRDMHPYLDPPRSAFQQPQRTSGYSRHLSKSPRKSLHIPTASAASNQSPRNRRTLSPHPSASHLKPPSVTRTMSLDPPPNSSFSSRIQPAPTMQDIQLESDHTRDLMSISRDVSMSPRHLRVRSSLTPQPSGTSFGPVVPPRRERDPNEPPPLTALMSNPMFVKPPPGLQKPGAAELGKQLTLGSLMDSHRKVRADSCEIDMNHSSSAQAHTPVRQSSILFGTGSMTDVSARMFYLLVAHPLVFDLRPAGHLWPVNAAEIALQELEVYKTPLLPTRLKGSATIPDMFVHKEKKQITLMTDDRPVKPRLGTKGKGKDKSKKKAKEAINGTKPYAGEGGMKKWLARRKREVEEAKDKDEAEAMEDERAEEEQRRKDAEAHEKKREQELRLPPPPPPSVPAFAPRPARETPLTSSLRVGRTRTGRNHIDRPVSRHPGKFSAVFEDEDEEMDEGRAAEQKALEEAAKKVPVFELPAGFTFAKEVCIH
jgi:nucleoporin NUP1